MKKTTAPISEEWLAKTDPANTFFVKLKNGNDYAVYARHQPRELKKPSEVIPADFLEYRLATLHFQEFDGYVFDGANWEDHPAPRRRRNTPKLKENPVQLTMLALGVADLPDADVLA